MGTAQCLLLRVSGILMACISSWSESARPWGQWHLLSHLIWDVVGEVPPRVPMSSAGPEPPTQRVFPAAPGDRLLGREHRASVPEQWTVALGVAVFNKKGKT